MKIITTSKGTFIFVIHYDINTYGIWNGILCINGELTDAQNVEIITTTKEITEEQAKQIIPIYSSIYPNLYANYQNNFYIESQLKTAKESLNSLLKSQGMNPENNYLILKQTK